MENFSNSIILPENLPTIKRVTFNRLDKKYLRILFIRLMIFFVFLVGGFIAFVLLNKDISNLAVIIISSGMLLFIICAILIIALEFPKKGYLVREKDVSFQRGLISYKLITVPFNRIQHVEVNQGVLAKLYKLSSIKIFTAGGMSSDLSIPGLPRDDAQKLKAFLSDKISEHE